MHVSHKALYKKSILLLSVEERESMKTHFFFVILINSLSYTFKEK